MHGIINEITSDLKQQNNCTALTKVLQKSIVISQSRNIVIYLLLASKINPCNHRIRELPGNCWCKARKHSCIIKNTS